MPGSLRQDIKSAQMWVTSSKEQGERLTWVVLRDEVRPGPGWERGRKLTLDIVERYYSLLRMS